MTKPGIPLSGNGITMPTNFHDNQRRIRNLECIIYDKLYQIATIKLNRPSGLNAMNKQLWLNLRTALRDAGGDPEIKAVVITGEGRAFSTGADLKDSKGRSITAYRDYLEHLQKISRELLRFSKPTIAAINGYTLGSGYELALACDIRIAAESAIVGSPEAKVSSSVTGGTMRLLRDLVGPGTKPRNCFSPLPTFQVQKRPGSDWSTMSFPMIS